MQGAGGTGIIAASRCEVRALVRVTMASVRPDLPRLGGARFEAAGTRSTVKRPACFSSASSVSRQVLPYRSRACTRKCAGWPAVAPSRPAPWSLQKRASIPPARVMTVKPEPSISRPSSPVTSTVYVPLLRKASVQL